MCENFPSLGENACDVGVKDGDCTRDGVLPEGRPAHAEVTRCSRKSSSPFSLKFTRFLRIKYNQNQESVILRTEARTR